MATSSDKVGNSTIQVGADPKTFIYQYKGFFGSAQTKINFTKYIGAGIGGAWIQNLYFCFGIMQTTFAFLIDRALRNRG